ncbi:hypothetical protein [Streptomyces demainii]|uniref:Uncharacterized protein n=1 Tax=Streptomyces demainii TaxID=588122 RepID=A0ABT9KH33_9ACTN|nr:hypothetical protein [Streptomyces demainii]MDP9607734.1 hypothetical protein [Streptomyces demainii]
MIENVMDAGQFSPRSRGQSGPVQELASADGEAEAVQAELFHAGAQAR